MIMLSLRRLKKKGVSSSILFSAFSFPRLDCVIFECSKILVQKLRKLELVYSEQYYDVRATLGNLTGCLKGVYSKAT